MTTTAATALLLPLGLIGLILFMLYSNKGAGSVRKSVTSILSIFEPQFKNGQFNKAARSILNNTNHINNEMEKAIYFTLAARALIAGEDSRQALFCLEIATPGYPKHLENGYKKFQPYKDECSTLKAQCMKLLSTEEAKEVTTAADGYKDAEPKQIAEWFQLD